MCDDTGLLNDSARDSDKYFKCVRVSTSMSKKTKTAGYHCKNKNSKMNSVGETG